jgi:hypothetical protein
MSQSLRGLYAVTRSVVIGSHADPRVINTCREEAALPLFSLLLQKEALQAKEVGRTMADQKTRV